MVENINICISHTAAHFKNSQQITIIILYSIFAVLMTVQKMRKSLVLLSGSENAQKPTKKKYIIILLKERRKELGNEQGTQHHTKSLFLQLDKTGQRPENVYHYKKTKQI